LLCGLLCSLLRGEKGWQEGDRETENHCAHRGP
jgi:hypothetical protein